MALFEKVFQRNDRIFIQFYFFALGLILYLSSMYVYYLKNGTLQLPETYKFGTILIVAIFWILGLFRTKENHLKFLKKIIQDWQEYCK